MPITGAVMASIPSPSWSSLDVGPLSFQVYGLMIALGVVAAVEIARRRWEALGNSGEDIADLAKWGVPAGLIGSRLYHVITDWWRYEDRPLDAFKIWEGGLGIPGGLIVGVGVGALYARKRGWDVARLADAVIPGIPVAQAIGRLGNWFNQEVFGRPTDLPWALEIDPEHRPVEYLDEPTFHPTFLYEGLANLALAWGLIRLDRAKVLRPGQLVPVWIIGYGVIRFAVESVRIDEATLIAGIRVNHWVSGVAVIVGVVWLLSGNRRERDVQPTPPLAWPDEHEPLRGPGSALDVACGAGAVSVWLAEQDFEVTAIDRSPDAIASVRTLAEDHKVARSVDASVHDLDLGLPPDAEGPFDLVVCQRFRDPELYPALLSAVAPGGHLVITVLTARGHDDPGPFRAPENELLDVFGPDLDVLDHRIEDGYEHLVGRRPE